jgi:hypothetical protein
VQAAAALGAQVADFSDTENLRHVWGLMKEMIRSSLCSKPGTRAWGTIGIERRIVNQLICSHESHCLIDQNTASLSFFSGRFSGSRIACSFLSRS